HPHWSHHRHATGGRGGDRDSLRMAWTRPALGPGNTQPRLPHRAVSRRLHVHDRGSREPGRRLALRGSRPQDPLQVSKRAAPARLGRHARGVFGGLLLVFVLALAVMPTLGWGPDPSVQSLRDRLKPPMWSEAGSAAAPLGTDALGRDLLARIAAG